jgi:hypothetical protein
MRHKQHVHHRDCYLGILNLAWPRRLWTLQVVSIRCRPLLTKAHSSVEDYPCLFLLNILPAVYGESFLGRDKELQLLFRQSRQQCRMDVDFL